MKKKVSQFINYVKEAFLWPVHLVGLGVMTLITVVAAFIIPEVTAVEFPWQLLMMLGGLEFLYLGAMSKNDRFIRAINSKYGKEIASFNKTRTITHYYNQLAPGSQQTFDQLHFKLTSIRKNYAEVHKNFPELINSFLDKINGIQISYIRLLTMRDKYPEYVKRQNPTQMEAKIAEIRESMVGDVAKIKQIKQKRIRLLEKRIAAFGKSTDNQKKVAAQLKTIEEMVEYMGEQALTMKTTDREDDLVDSLLIETEEMTDTLTDLESILSGDFDVGGYDLEMEEGFTSEDMTIPS